uniref:Uncharacterized protein n=1 Tax=Panagrolaimus sp. JU765 TaxID=591449 RepID=A0AC34QSR9_9BILA
MNKKKGCICISVSIVLLLIAVAIAVTLVLVLRKHKKDETPSLDDVISDNSTFPDGSYQISVESLKSGPAEHAPLFVNVSMLNDLGVTTDNSSFVAETNRLSYFFVRLPPESSNKVTNARIKRQATIINGSIGIRFGNSEIINVIPLNLSTIVNSGVRFSGMLPDNSQVYQLEVRMADAMCSNNIVGSCSIVNWTPYSISNDNIGSQASFVNELPVACGSQCDADANSPCATSCSTCDGQQVAGADTPVTRRYRMNTTAAQYIQFSYQTYEVKDRIIVSYEGKNLFDSGCVGTGTTRYFPISYNGTSKELRVDVEPNCKGTTGTAWDFTLPCAADCQNCNKYKCLDDSKAHCGPQGYLMGYGLYFCNRYYEYYNNFNADGQAFIDCVRPKLLDFIDDYINQVSGKVDCGDLYNKAFDSHVQIYADCNFCYIFYFNPVQITKVIYQSIVGSKITLDAWKQIVTMVAKCNEVYAQDGLQAFCRKFPNTPCICTSCSIMQKYLCEEFPNLTWICS